MADRYCEISCERAETPFDLQRPVGARTIIGLPEAALTHPSFVSSHG